MSVKRALEREKVVLVGAGGHGRGTLEILRARIAAGLAVPEIIGFVDDDPKRQGAGCGGLEVFGPLEWLLERAGEGYLAVLGISSPQAKRDLSTRLDEAGFGYFTVIHPSAIVGAGTNIGPGSIVGAGAVIAYDTTVGRHTTINLNTTVGHDCVVGDYCTVAPGVNMTGRVRVGEGAVIQTNATIVPDTAIGAWSRVGPGAVVLQDVAEGEFVFGNPARRMPGGKF